MAVQDNHQSPGRSEPARMNVDKKEETLVRTDKSDDDTTTVEVEDTSLDHVNQNGDISPGNDLTHDSSAAPVPQPPFTEV